MTSASAAQAAHDQTAAQHHDKPAAKQAVVVIHGIGEQKPMDTIKAFVDAVWVTDPDIAPKWDGSKIPQGAALPDPEQIWSRPDRRSGSLELRRITTRKSIATPSFPGGVRTDFYELYWADLSIGSTVQQVEEWVAVLLFRNPMTRVPGKLISAWLLLWLLSLAVVILALATALPADAKIFSIRVYDIIFPLKWLSHFQDWQLAAATVLLGYLTHKFVVPYAGRVVRYTRATPDNIAARKDVRERGLQLLRDLHTAEYDRIILVGHSLGSIVAYDLLTYFWAEKSAAHTMKTGTDEFAGLCRLAQATIDLMAPTNPAGGAGEAKRDPQTAFLEAQTSLCRALRQRPKPGPGETDSRWILTDLVTLGSPLTHAEFLVANSKDDLAQRKTSREFPSSPPTRETQDPEVADEAMKVGLPIDPLLRQSFCFPLIGPSRDSWQLDHGAPFAVVRWTNIYDPAALIFLGDIISGPVAPAFGPGVGDVNLKALTQRQSLRFTHTRYWSNDVHKKSDGGRGATPPRIVALRRALDLAGQYRTL
jgi:hypothetical protein